jgi:hypothetical protein
LSVVVIDCGDDPVGVVEVIILWILELDISIGLLVGYCMIEKSVREGTKRVHCE